MRRLFRSYHQGYREGYEDGRKDQAADEERRREDIAKLRACVKRVSAALNANVGLQDLVDVCTTLAQQEREVR